MSAYRLSVVGSVAPPGTAWDAEGLRGNEANKNKLMVLVRVQARKWQSGRVLHKRTSPVVSSSFGSPASNWEALAPLETSRTQMLGRPAYLKALAGSRHFGIDGNCLYNLDHGGVRWQQPNQPANQSFPRTLQKGAAAVA